MNTLVMKNLEIDLLIDLLSNQCSDILSKVWRNDDLVSGVFILEEPKVKDLGVSITTVVEHKVPDATCKLTIHGSRVLDQTEVAEAAEAHLRQTLIEFAEENEWAWE
ncbi:MAG: hypothetical protein ACFFEF_04185 [Candidatus Thorarchaeota archaeon]